MYLVGLTLLGIAFGAAGSEFLRSRKPELVDKMEKRVRLFIAGILDPPEPESKLRENLRYIGYMAGMVGGLVALLLIFFFLDIIVDVVLVWMIDHILSIIIIVFVIGIMIAAYYYFFKRGDE